MANWYLRHGVQVKPLTSIENARMLPKSESTASVACTVHVPADATPAKPASGWAGWNVPVHGAGDRDRLDRARTRVVEDGLAEVVPAVVDTARAVEQRHRGSIWRP